MTATKVMDIISRLPGCDGQGADAVSANTQVKNGRCSKITEQSRIGMSNMEDPAVPLERNLYGHLLEGLLWERQFEKSC